MRQKPKPSPSPKPEPKPEPKPRPNRPPQPADDGARRRPCSKASRSQPRRQPRRRTGRFVVQVGAFADAAKAREARLKVERAGLKTYTHVAETKDGKRIRVRVGPFDNRAEADKAARKIKGLDLPAAILTCDTAGSAWQRSTGSLLAVLAASLLLGAWRGLVYEVLSVLSWVAAFVLAQWLAPDVARASADGAAPPKPVRYAAGFVLVFIGAVFAGGLLAWLTQEAGRGRRPAARWTGRWARRSAWCAAWCCCWRWRWW